jgi:hypothetical protein
VVADHFVDHETDELLAELGIEIGFLGQAAQALNLPFLARRVGRRHRHARLVFADFLGDAKALRQHMDQGGVDIVDALAETRENLIGRLVVGLAGHRQRTVASNPRLPSRPAIAKCEA